ncbi:MAG: translation initiation factor IF-2 [Bacteroidota bacterium]
MAETTKAKKLRIYKLASEINISTEAIVDFLKEKGYKIKNHMTILTDEMLTDINEHFKKDIDKSDEHKRKLARFNQIRAEKAEADSHKPEELEEEVEEETEPSSEDEAEKEQAEVISETEIEESETVEEVVEESLEDDDIDSFKTDAEKEIRDKKKGLTVLGKIDLKTDKKKRSKKKDDVQEVKKTEASTESAKTEGTETSTESKSKRKRLKAKRKPGGVEETVKAKKFKKVKKAEVDKREVEAAIKRTMLSMDDSALAERASHRKKKRKEKLEEQEQIELEQIELEQSKIKVTEYIAVNELANLMNVSVSDVIAKCIGMGLMVSINQRLDSETITLVADEFDFEVEFEEEYQTDLLADIEDAEDTLAERPPVVTIMGHVDHGKTSLLDYIRRENVVAGESGGITQHIGAYQVKGDDGKNITFLDTPGHEAFTAMRARGAKITDIVVLIVAADDAVMPQTIEAINHAQAAAVPIIIAINKIDKPGANVEKIKQQLAERNILVEDWGGKYQSVEVSAKSGLNVDTLLEKILLESEILELKANPDRIARGNVVEAQMEPGRGITATILIHKGTLRVGDPFVAGNFQGRVRAMFDERGKKLSEVTPGSPALILGFEGIPQAGDIFAVVNSEREAREISLKRQQLKREQDHRQVKLITLDEIAHQISTGEVKDLPIIVKGDVDGSVEALADSMMKLSNEEVKVNVIHKAVGGITEGDVLLAAASGAIIVGFHVRANLNARKLAETEKIEIRLYNVIYDAINQVKSALEGLLSPVISEEFVATVEVRDTFKVPKIGTVAGCYVQDGKITRTDKIRLFRDGIVIYEGNLATLKRFKDDVKEVVAGYECGLNIANFNDIKVNDIIEAYKIVETKKKLED